MDSAFKMKSFTLVPPPFTGVNMDTRKKVELHTTGEALDLYYKVAGRLADINEWNNLHGIKRNMYALYDMNGDPKQGTAEEGDYIRFSLPAPHLKNGSRFDWVRIERILEIKHDERNSTAMRVRPAADPTFKMPWKQAQTSHFYTNKTTNTFVVERLGVTVTVGIHPRNEIINTKQTTGFYNMVRNILVGVTAWVGVSKGQWKSLIAGLMHEE